MELGLTQRWIIAANALLIVLIAYLAAITVNDIIGWSLGGGTSDDAASVPARALPRSGKHPRAYYDQIVRRDVFSLRPTAASAPIATEDLRVKLLGTSLMTVDKPFAIIEDQGGRQDVYRVGEEIPGAGRLVAVEINRAIIDRGGRRVAIEIPDSVKAALEATPATARPGPFRPSLPARPMLSREELLQRDREIEEQQIKNLGPHHYSVSREFVSESFLSLGELAEGIRARPNVVGGKTNGFALSEIQSGSVFERIGLQDGDILMRVDGRPLNDPAKALAMIPLLRERTSVQVEVIRGGKPVSLKFDMR
jgi:general secretion pathway protein C